MKTIYLTDRSRIDTREECERKRYLTYDFDIDGIPTGIQRVEIGLPLLNGIQMHVAHARVLGGETLENVAARIIGEYRDEVLKRGVHGVEKAAREALITEQSALLEGMLRAFVYEWLPRILEEYDIESIEKPMDWEMAPGLVQKLRFDVVLRRKGDGQLVILDFKSMPYVSDAWGLKIERSRQTSLYISAAQELLGESVEMAYLGIVKGTRRKDTAMKSPFYGEKIQASPYTYAYALKGGVGTVYQSAYTSKKGFEKVRTYEEMPVKDWLDHLWRHERNVVKEQFVFNPPIAPTPRELHRVRELVVREELRAVSQFEEYRKLRDKAERTGDPAAAAKAEEYLDYVAAPMRESACYKYGQDSKCAFIDICFNEGALENIGSDPSFEPREPHHNTELEEVAA